MRGNNFKAMKHTFIYSIIMALVLAFAASATIDAQQRMPRKRLRIDGWRIQVFSGGNTHNDKIEAQTLGNRARIWYSEHTVYTHFKSPHWTCRVGDFQKREDAEELLKQMRRSGRFPKAAIIKSVINIYEDEKIKDEQEHIPEQSDSTGIGLGGDSIVSAPDTTVIR